MKSFRFLNLFAFIMVSCSPSGAFTITPTAREPIVIASFTQTPLPSPTETPTLLPTVTSTPVDVVGPITYSDVNGVEDYLNENLILQRFIWSDVEGNIDSRVVNYINKYLMGLAQGVIPEADLTTITVTDYNKHSLESEPIYIELGKLSSIGLKETGGKIVIITLENNVNFSDGSVYDGPYPLETPTFNELMNFYAKQYDKFFGLGVNPLEGWPLNKQFTMSNENVIHLVIGLGKDRGMLEVFYDLYHSKEISTDDIARPDIVFILDPSKGITLQDISSVKILDVTGDPNNLMFDLRRSYELQLGVNSGQTFEEFVKGVIIGASIFINAEDVQLLTAPE